MDANIASPLDTSAEPGAHVQQDHLPAVLLFQRVVSSFDFIRIRYQKSIGFLPGALKAARQGTGGNGTALAVSQALDLAGLLIGKRIEYVPAESKPDGSFHAHTAFSKGSEVQVSGTWKGGCEHSRDWRG